MIGLNDFKRQWAEIGPAAMAAVERVGASGRYILGREVESFEGKLSEFWGVSHAVGVANGMDAIEIALRALDLQHFRTIKPAPSAEPVWNLFPIFVEAGERDNVRERLLGGGIASGVHYPRLIPEQPAMQLPVSYEVATEPVNARRLAASELSLPIHPFLRDGETQLVVASCRGQ